MEHSINCVHFKKKKNSQATLMVVILNLAGLALLNFKLKNVVAITDEFNVFHFVLKTFITHFLSYFFKIISFCNYSRL